MYIENFNSIKLHPLPKKGGLFEEIELTKEKCMNCYEHTLIAKQDLSESQSQKLVDKYQNIINKNLGKVLKIENWGLRNLAYKIKNNKKGFYFHIKFEGVGKTIEELEGTENIDETLLRFLTVKVKKHDFDTNFFEKKDDYTLRKNEEKKEK